jgi:Transposase IS116/IS110/IS902 family
MRDLSRARLAAKKDFQGKRQQISSLMLRLGRCYPGKATWGPAHMKWLMSQKLEHREQRMALEELLEGVRQEGERVERLEQAIREAVPEWSLAEVVTPLQAMRGIDLIAAVGVLAEIGDLSRFQNPRELMGYLGLVPSESSTGDRVKRGGITKAGNSRARRILVEAAWSNRYPARVGREKQPKVAAAPRRVREIAWKAQTRLCGWEPWLQGHPRLAENFPLVVEHLLRPVEFRKRVILDLMRPRRFRDAPPGPNRADHQRRPRADRPAATLDGLEHGSPGASGPVGSLLSSTNAAFH